MVDENNGFDGNDGANQGEGKNGDGHDMDMDNKRNDMDVASKGNEQNDASMHNGVDGMQEQCGNLEAIRIGTMQVKFVSLGNLSDAKKLNKKDLVYTPLSHVVFAALNDEFCSDSHVDTLSSDAALGSAGVGSREVGRKPVIGQGLPDALLAHHAANERQLCMLADSCCCLPLPPGRLLLCPLHVPARLYRPARKQPRVRTWQGRDPLWRGRSVHRSRRDRLGRRRSGHLRLAG
jgi:hypothetical protein